MKTITFIVLALAAVSLSQANNDGRYHYNNYNNLAYRNGKYGSTYNGYQQPQYYQALNRELLTPAVSYGDSVEQDTAAYPTNQVTYRTPVTPFVSTYRPFVYSTPKPIVYSTQKPIVYSTQKPIVYSTPKPIVYSTQKPIVYSTQKPIVYSTPKPFALSTKQVHAPAAVYHKSVSDAAASIVREDRAFDENNYHYAYETDNGIAAEESGIVDTSANGVGGGTRVRGFYEYIGDDGLKYRVDYTADENGFRASGAHLPKAP